MFELWLTRLDKLFTAAACVSMMLMLVITMISVIGRYVFNTAIPDDIVMNELLMPLVVFLPMAFVQRHDDHVVVTLISDRLNQVHQERLKTWANVMGLLVISMFAYATWVDFAEAWAVGSHSDGILGLPDYPTRFVISLSLTLFALRLMLDIIRRRNAHHLPDFSEV